MSGNQHYDMDALNDWNERIGKLYFPEELEYFHGIQERRRAIQAAMAEASRGTFQAGTPAPPTQHHPGHVEHQLTDYVEHREGVLGIFKIPVRKNGLQMRDQAECILQPGKNLIVNTGREALRRLQAHTAEGATAAGSYDLGYLAVGDGSLSGATVPQPTDTSLINEITDPVGGPVVSGVPRPLLTVTAPPPGPPFTTNLWTAQIGTTQFNGQTINEAGLVCLNDITLFAFRTFTNQTKDAGFVMEFRWSIIF